MDGDRALMRARASATRKTEVRRAGVIVHVDSGWAAQRRAGDAERGIAMTTVGRTDVRSAR
jgi:hypothetical protein